MFCPKCGSKIHDDAKFCNVCGAPTQSAVPPKPHEVAVPKSGGSKSVLICVIIVLVGILAVAGFYIAGLLADKQDEPLYSPPYIEGDAEEEYEEESEEPSKEIVVEEKEEVSEESSEKPKRQKNLIDCFEVKSHHAIFTKSSARDSIGNEYTDILYGGRYSGSITYNIKGDFSSLYGNYSVMKGENQTGKVWFEIYADEVKIFDSEKLVYGDFPQSFEVDVTGVQMLRIEFNNTKDGHPYGINCLIEATLTE